MFEASQTAKTWIFRFSTAPSWRLHKEFSLLLKGDIRNVQFTDSYLLSLFSPGEFESTGFDLGKSQITGWPRYLARWQKNYSAGRGRLKLIAFWTPCASCLIPPKLHLFVLNLSYFNLVFLLSVRAVWWTWAALACLHLWYQSLPLHKQLHSLNYLEHPLEDIKTTFIFFPRKWVSCVRPLWVSRFDLDCKQLYVMLTISGAILEYPPPPSWFWNSRISSLILNFDTFEEFWLPYHNHNPNTNCVSAN